MIRRGGELLRGLVAVATIMTLVAGVPLALVAAVGSPLPSAIPSIDALREALTSRGVDDVVVVKAVALVIWLAWAQVVGAFVLEVVALLRGRPARVLPGARSAQAGVARLVAATALISSAFAGLRVAPASAHPAIVPAVATVISTSPMPIGPEDLASPLTRPSPVERANYEVQRHDSLWSIAERTLGDGLRWREVRDLNAGRPMTDGTILDPSSDVIQPGWVLELPSDAQPDRPPSELREGNVTVQPGDSLWSIAEDTATAALGHEPSAIELHDHWERIVDANTERLLDPTDAGLIFSGQQIAVPATGPIVASPVAAATTSPIEPVTTNEAVPLPPVAPPDDGNAPSAVATTEADDDDASGFVGRLGIAGSALAAGLAGELYRRRRRRAGRLSTGTAAAPPTSDLDEIRTEIALAADDDLIARRNGAIRALSQALATAHPAIRPRLIQASSERVEVLLSGSAVPAPAPWSVEGGGSVWATVDDLRATPGDDPSPALVAVGAPEGGGQLYVDLEAVGILAITGEHDECTGLVRSIVTELGSGASGQRVDVVLVDADELAQAAGDECSAARWADVADDLLARSTQSTELLQANRWRTSFHARAVRGPDDGLAPLVAVFGTVPDDPRFDDLCRRVADGMTTLSVVLLGTHHLGTSAVVGDGLIHLPSIDLTCRSQSLEPDAAADVRRLLDETAGDGQLVLLDELDPTPRSFIDLAEAGPRRLDVRVRLLGEIDIVGGSSPFKPKQVAVMAYIALHAPVSTERVQDAVWPSATGSRSKRLSNTMSDVRALIGATHLPIATDGRYTIGPAVGTDLQEFDRLTHLAAQAPLGEAIALLRSALELVRGPVFTYRSADRSSFVWIDLENWLTTWELKVANAALRLSDLALDADDADTAIWSAERGLSSIPIHSALTEALMRGYWRRGDRGAAETVYLSHVAALENLDIDDVAETTIDLRDQIRASQSA